MNVTETEVFADWLSGLRDVVGRRAIVKRIVRLQTTGNFGDWAAIEGSLREMRIHVGPGYRVYFVEKDGAILLCGGDKGTQVRDIEKAKKLAEEFGG